MPEQKSFKTRVKEEAVRCSKIYKDLFVDYDYLLCSEAFTDAEYYIIQAHEDNYEHLTGVGTNLKAATFLNDAITELLRRKISHFRKGINLRQM